MKIHHTLMRENRRPLVLAIGFFDGLHRGHMELVRQTRRLRRPGWRSGVLTFSNHPTSFLRPGEEPPMLATPQERVDMFALAGFEECFLLPFDEHISRMSPEAFLDALLGLGVHGVCVGATFRFGHKRTGDFALMHEYLVSRGVECIGVVNVTDEGERISSTRIRGLVAAGNLELADHLLGHSYELRGSVELGAGRGHDLGFPTANVRVPEKMLPKDGVYSAVARYDGRDYAALVSIGTNPQFNGERRTIEAWLRDFHETIYGRELALRDLRFVREQRVFTDVEELVAQMQRDVMAVAYPSFG
ncbi:MAG: riboflavin biosynthesis protein RibF [Vulcanimicrobiaceae bacterium]